MKSKVFLSIFCIVGMLSMTTAATAGQVVMTQLSHASFIGTGPGPDGIIGAAGTPAAADDTADAMNTVGSTIVQTYEWSSPDPVDCIEVVGTHDAVQYTKSSSSTWCLGDPSAGEFKVTALTQTLGPGPGVPFDLNISLDTSGSPNSGSPCPAVGDVTYTVDLKILVGIITIDNIDYTETAKVYLVSDNNPAPFNCQTADGTATGYTTADLLAMKALLPGNATAYVVSCSRFQAPDDTLIECFDPGPYTGLTGIMYTTDDVSACDGVCGDGGGCMAATAEAVE